MELQVEHARGPALVVSQNPDDLADQITGLQLLTDRYRWFDFAVGDDARRTFDQDDRSIQPPGQACRRPCEGRHSHHNT